MSTQMMPSAAGIAFGNVTPVLRVSDVKASEEYYVRRLGFKVGFRTPGFVSVTRGRCCLFLCEGDQGHPGGWVWIDGVDVETVYDELRSSGAKIRHQPTNYPWALEMQVEDPDGNVLRIGSDPKTDEPTGEWLDMKGVRWAPQPGGGWKRVEQP
jgi:catechol 2,3-dioxygenase-like lactoylglutathione lyase family enzyme